MLVVVKTQAWEISGALWGGKGLDWRYLNKGVEAASSFAQVVFTQVLQLLTKLHQVKMPYTRNALKDALNHLLENVMLEEDASPIRLALKEAQVETITDFLALESQDLPD